jgi:hypothetical protein
MMPKHSAAFSHIKIFMEHKTSNYSWLLHTFLILTEKL